MDYYDYDYMTPVQNVSSSVPSCTIWIIISIVVAIIGGIALYFTVFNPNNKKEYKGFMSKLYDYFNFKHFILDDLFRIFYLINAIGLTLLSFTFIKSSILYFLLILIVGNIVLRIIFELLMLTIELCRNVREINGKIKEKK